MTRAAASGASGRPHQPLRRPQRPRGQPARQLPGHGAAARPLRTRPPAATPAATSSAPGRSTCTSMASGPSGATVHPDGDLYLAESPAERGHRLKGARFFLDYPSVTGTMNLIFAAVLAEGTTTLVNAAAEPEIVDVIEMLQRWAPRSAAPAALHRDRGRGGAWRYAASKQRRMIAQAAHH